MFHWGSSVLRSGFYPAHAKDYLTWSGILLKKKNDVGMPMALKKNENKGDVMLTLSQKTTWNCLKTDK